LHLFSSDYEYDSDEEEDFDQLPPGGVNETLTKKKYCQSFKLFHQIFDSVKQFEAFQRSVSKMKKYIFGIIFALFLEALPPATRFRIPQELWEKVWKFTQNAYFRYKDSVPLHKDASYYRAGLRGPDTRLAGLERERLRELYGSVGNLHMIMFEVLFKNPSILQPNPLFELEAGESAQEKLARGAFRSAMQAARTGFSRLQQLEPVLAEPADSTAAVLATAAGLELEQKMAAGTFLVTDIELKLQPLPSSVAKLDPPSSVIVSRSVCSRFVLTGRYPLTEDGEEFGLLLTVISAVTGEVEQIIHTGHSYQNHLIEVGACGVRRKGGASWKNHFFLTEDRISFMTRVVEAATDTVRAWSFALPAAAAPTGRPPLARGGPPLVTAVSRPGRAVTGPRPQPAAAIGHTASALLLLVQSPFAPGPHTCLTLYSLECGEALLEVPWPGQHLALLGLTDSRALLAGPASILFFSLTAGEVVQAFQLQQLNTEHSLDGSEPWSAVFDCEPARRQLLLYTPTLSAFQLLQWQEQEMAPPVLLLRGAPVAEAAEGLGTNVLLSGGSLITNRSRDLPLAGAPGGPTGHEDGRLASHEVAGWGLAAGARHQLLSMAADRAQGAAADLLLNQLSQRRWDEAWAGRPDRQLWNPDRRPVFMVQPGVVGLLLESGTRLRTIDFTLAAGEVAQAEADWLEREGGGPVGMEE
jgi:hypothetical protein